MSKSPTMITTTKPTAFVRPVSAVCIL